VEELIAMSHATPLFGHHHVGKKQAEITTSFELLEV
jgi:hypothetical protein